VTVPAGEFAGLAAVVTGGGSGIGLATARLLAERGARVAVLDLDPSAAAPLLQVRADVTDDAAVRAAVEGAAAEMGGLDVLVNNAGIIGGGRPPLETGPADFLACYGVNLLGPVRVTRAFLPLLRRSAAPRIVNVSSGVGSIGIVTDPDRMESQLVSLVYPSSKAALNMVTVMYAKALPEFRVNAVDPGYTATDLNGHRGHQTVEQGARAVVAAARVAPDGPTGGFFDATGPIPW
jgi:NAD(P)-dependent dehydrogenase (short-subunit alcohol dehydrogenase family)